MTSCQVFEKSNKGPVAAQTSTTRHARTKAIVLPAQRVTVAENCSLRFASG